jgi:hypothetical protein
MRINDIKKGVYSATLTAAKGIETVDLLIVSCLVYDIVKRLISNQTSFNNDVRSMAESYIRPVSRNLNLFKRSFISYAEMRSQVESFGHSSFLQFTASQISSIVRLYQDRTRILPFSSAYFSQYMYKLSNVSQADYERMTRVHTRTMAPIARFYTDQYGKSDSDLEVFSALVYRDRPGKEILFSVRGIQPSRVVADILTSRVPIRKNSEYVSVSIDGNYVRILTI